MMRIASVTWVRKTAWKPLAVVSGLVVMLTYLFLQSRSSDLALKSRMDEELRTLTLHDAQLTRDVLLARAGLLANYDSLAHTGRQMRDALEALGRETATFPGNAALDIRPHVDALSTVVHDKLALVEYFKSDNALLRNSSTYFVHAGQRLGARLGAGVPAPAAEITALSQAILRLMQSPGASAEEEARRHLARLSRRSALPADGNALATHGKVILDVLPEVDGLVRQIVAAPITARAEAVEDVVMRHASGLETRAQVFRVLLYLVAVVLVGYVLYQFRRLQMGEERFRAITESANDAIVSVDLRGRIASWNAKAETIFGYRADEILGASMIRLMPSRYQRLGNARFVEQAAARGARLAGRTLELTGRRRDQTEFPLELSLSTWSTARGRYVTAMIRDLTSRRQLEETTRQQELQLIQANKMTTLGTLVSGIAHEINSPNQLVLMSASTLGEAWGDALEVLDSRRQEGDFTLAGVAYTEVRSTIGTLLQDIRDGARRVERIVSDLKNFTRPPAHGSKTPCRLNDVVERALRLLAHSIRTRTDRFEVTLEEGMPAIEGDVQQLEQVVVNLVMNALESLPDRHRGVHLITAFDRVGEAVVLEVCDEGVGIAAEHLNRVCEPFFTTKRESGGTGLGLAITSSLVRAHGGRLTFSSGPKGGTRAVVVLPLSRA